MGLPLRPARHDPRALAVTGDLFARIGELKTLQITADFLIGWRVGILTDGSGTSVPIRKLLPESNLAARVISTSPAATPI